MGNIKSKNQTKVVTIICLTFVILTTFYYHIDKHLTGIGFIILTLLIPTTFIAMLVYLIKGLIGTIRNRNNLTLLFCMPTIITVITFLFISSPWYFDSEDLESKIEFRACYEGTQNQSSIKFREDKSFEIHSTGVFFANSWYTGHWNKSGDTLFMEFDDKNPGFIGDTLVIRNEYLIELKKLALTDSTKDYRKNYYLGSCKGLN